MLTGRMIDDRFLDRWEKDVCHCLQRAVGRPFMLARGSIPSANTGRRSWLIDPILASVCAHQPVAAGYVLQFEPEKTGVRLWVGVGVTDEPVLGEFLRASFDQPGFVASIKPLFRRLDATSFMGQGGWVRSQVTSGDRSPVALAGTLLDEVSAVYAPVVPGAEFLVAEAYRTYDTADDMEVDAERVAGRLAGDFGVLYNGLFPRTTAR
jgi:hypothetical protein